MKHFLNAKRKKSPDPPEQSIFPGRPAGIADGPSASQIGPDSIPDDEGGRMSPRIMFRDGMDMDQALPASGARTSGYVIGSSDYGNRPAAEGTNYIGGETERTDASRAKVARRGTLLGGVQDDTEKFGPLKLVLGGIPALYANHEEIVTVSNRVKNLLSRVVALEERFNSRPSDVTDQRHRDGLIRKLNNIEERLRLLSEKLGSFRLVDRVRDDEDLLRRLEDLREAILDYQTAQQTATGDQGSTQIDPAEAVVLNNLRYAQQAEYRHGNRNGCLKGTRTAILDEIELWICDFDKPPVYWLNGLAGTGKSTIAQTIAERTFADGRLGASFFCSRDFEDRGNLQSIFPTLAVQLARKYTQFRSAFVKLVQQDPEIVHESLYNQLEKLIVQPLARSTISTVIVIDALDECNDEEAASAILSVLGQFVANVPKVKFFITGRPEPRIREGFRLPLLAKETDVFVLHEVEPSRVNNDIRLFFRHSFSEIKRHRRGLGDWPTEEQLNLLCERAGGLFVYAVATVRFIDKRINSPKKQLDRLLQSRGGSIFEGKTKFKADATLDSLYASILQEAFDDDDDPENDLRVRSVLGAVVLAANPLSPSAIAALLGFEPEDVFPLLSSVHSLLVLQEDINYPVQPFHKSFPDFIIDPLRCTNPRFRLCPLDQHTELLVGCLQTMNRKLERNMCKLPDWVLNSEVVDLKERVKEHIDQALEYACRSWHKHLVGTIPAHVGQILHQFLEKKFLFWLEVLSVLGAAREAVDALEATAKCEWVSPTLHLVKDSFRFAVTFFEVISTSAPHIYHSALPLSPRTSAVYELYKQYSCPLVRVVRGLPLLWEPVIATVYLHNFSGEVVWSPCNRFIAISKFGSAEILDAITLDRLSSFEYPRDSNGWQLSFSPDSCFLTLFDRRDLASWDLQTGGPLGTILLGLDGLPAIPFSFTYSMDGKAVAITYEVSPADEDEDEDESDEDGKTEGENYEDENVEGENDGRDNHNQDNGYGYGRNSHSIDNYSHSYNSIDSNNAHDNDSDKSNYDNRDVFVSTYTLLSRTRRRHHRVSEGRIIAPIWTHGEHFRFATVELQSITIWEALFGSTHTPTQVKTFPSQNETLDGERFLFLPALSRLAFVQRGTVLIWDARAPKRLLKSGAIPALHFARNPDMAHSSSRSSFSSDGGFFACMTAAGEVYVWKESPPGYILHQRLAFSIPDDSTGPRLSPNGESIIISLHSAIHLWSTRDQVLPYPNVPAGNSNRHDFIMGFSPDEALAAFARRGGNMVTILDLQSGNSRFAAHAGMRVDCLGISGNSVVVVGEGKVITWSPPRENHTFTVRANMSDTCRTTVLDRTPPSRFLDEPTLTSISPDLIRVAISGYSTQPWGPGLEIYDVSTGRCLGGIRTPTGLMPKFTPDGGEVWGVSDYSTVEGWKATGDGKSGVIELKPLRQTTHPPAPPWRSSHGYEVTDNGWVINSTKKRLLWLPHRWRSNWKYRAWCGRFLGLLHGELSEVVILEFFE